MIRFGDVEIDPPARTLTRRGRFISVEPRVFDLLEYLIAHSDRVLSKRELAQAVWPRPPLAGSAVSRAIMKARRALGDDSHKPRYIVTVPGRGYRFQGPHTA